MGMDVRIERATDAPAIRNVHNAAFGGPAEGLLVDELRRLYDMLLSLVAVDQGEIIGHIAFSRMRISGGAPEEAVSLAPLGVAPSHQSGGIGTALTKAGLGRLRDAGETLVFVLGDPAYYGRFGFSAEAARAFTSPWPGEVFQALWLVPAIPDSGGVVHYSKAFEMFED